MNREEFLKKNNEERMNFVDLWSKYVLEHDDKVWSKQQNIIINSNLKSANMTKEEYLKMKDKRLKA